MHRRVERGIRLGGVGLAGLVYLLTGLPTCAGHAAYFRERLMKTAECEGASLDLLASGLAVALAWLAVRSKKAPRPWLLVVLALACLTVPALAAMVNCSSR